MVCSVRVVKIFQRSQLIKPHKIKYSTWRDWNKSKQRLDIKYRECCVEGAKREMAFPQNLNTGGGQGEGNH